MIFTIKTTGTTEGCEHYYGDLFVGGEKIDSWYYKPNTRKRGVFKLRLSSFVDCDLLRLVSKRFGI